MPYEKVLITHKFGIISQSYKKYLQRLLYDRYTQLTNEEQLLKKKKEAETLQLQITEEFVKEYNEASFAKRTASLNKICEKIYEKLKTKTLQINDIDDLNLQLVWAELSQLIQCNSPIQEGNFNSLYLIIY
jgi:hypothetical protein